MDSQTAGNSCLVVVVVAIAIVIAAILAVWRS
jgi:hypothetical protein